MERAALSFFSDFNRILQEYLLLESAKITDPAKTMKKENFTVDNLLLGIDWPPDIRKKLISLKDKTDSFRDYIKEARDKLLAHLDKETFLTSSRLGGFPEGEEEGFLRNLQEICDVIH